MDAGDRRMDESQMSLRLVPESRDIVLVPDEIVGRALERTIVTQGHVPGAVDDRGASLPDLLPDLVGLQEPRAGNEVGVSWVAHHRPGS
jgi:hypothetical protein